MLRTQISLTAEEMRAARREANRLGISLAELLRRSLRVLLSADATRPWMRYAGMTESGDSSSSRRVDDVIWRSEGAGASGVTGGSTVPLRAHRRTR